MQKLPDQPIFLKRWHFRYNKFIILEWSSQLCHFEHRSFDHSPPLPITLNGSCLAAHPPTTNMRIKYDLICMCVCVCMWFAQSCLTLCDPMDCSTPGSFVHGILQARILEWVAISFSLSMYVDCNLQVFMQFSGEGNGNPFQCSCLENPRDGGAWWAAIYGVA